MRDGRLPALLPVQVPPVDVRLSRPAQAVRAQAAAMRALILTGPNRHALLNVIDPPPQHIREHRPEPRDSLEWAIRNAYGPRLASRGIDIDTVTYDLLAVGSAGAVYGTGRVDPDMAEDFANDPDLWPQP